MRPMLHRLYVLIPCAVAALLAWIFLPDSAVDRALFSLTARSFANPPFFITGNGTHFRPHTLRTLKSSPGGIPEKLPTIVSLGDDPDGFFQSSPPSPVDFAIILKNFKRLGETGPAIAIPLAWQEADMISLAALDLQLDSLPSIVTTAPLSRNPIPSPMPPAFRRASVPVSGIEGDRMALPIVNHIPIPNIVLGNKTSFAGFAFLESEPAVGAPHLLARWDDSVVFSFPLLTAMRHFQVPPSALKIRLGEYISFSRNGPFIPIDKHGRLAFSPVQVAEGRLISAPSLIDAPDDLLSGNRLPPAILRNDLSSADAQTRDFSKYLAGTVASLTNPSFTTNTRIFPRLQAAIELCLLGSLVLVMTAMSHHPFAKKPLAFLIAVCAFVAIHFTLVPLTDTWLPTLPAIAALGAFAIKSFLPVPQDQVIEPPAQKSATQETATKTPAKKAAKKAAKTTTRKVAKKATRKTAKKAARKTARKTPTKKPPKKST